MLTSVPRVTGNRNRFEVVEAIGFFLAVLAYLWFFLIPLPWTGVALLLVVAASWWQRSQTVESLGLGWRALGDSVRQWGPLWVICILPFLFFGYRTLFRLPTLERGLVYFAWSAAQQVVYQSMMYLPLRGGLRSARLAAALAGVAFALVHAPNPILVPATLLWGIASSLLFERCRSVWGLALLQVMLSSMLMWVTPPGLHRGFTIGPFYHQPPPVPFAPPIMMDR